MGAGSNSFDTVTLRQRGVLKIVTIHFQTLDDLKFLKERHHHNRKTHHISALSALEIPII